RSVHVERTPGYHPATGLSGAIEGVVTWRGPAPRPLTTSCGAIEPLALERGRLAGVLIYIERVSIGRALPAEGRPASVGGLVVKRGCALGPAVQIATPLPAPLIIHGDARRAR